jgi:hypothetical protein
LDEAGACAPASAAESPKEAGWTGFPLGDSAALPPDTGSWPALPMMGAGTDANNMTTAKAIAMESDRRPWSFGDANGARGLRGAAST